MSLYNALFGVNPAKPILMAALRLDGESPDQFYEKLEEFSDKWGDYDLSTSEAQALLNEAKESKYFPTGRFRDIYFNNEDGTPKIVLYTRNGGGNRDSYEYVFNLLESHPLYIRDYDDDFDSTYAYIEFNAPQVVIDFFDGVYTGKLETVSEKFKAEIEAMEAGKTPNSKLMDFVENIVNEMKK